MHLDTLPKGYKEIISKISKYTFIKDFYLSGGTALALQIGHRESIDFDFFNESNFDPEEVLKVLSKDFNISDLTISKGTLNCTVNEIKFQFLHYPYHILEEFIDWDGINLSSVIDVACTKMITVSARGSKKDYVDIYYLLQRYSINELFENMDKKYIGLDFNKVHILKSLTNFTEADQEPMPRMQTEVDWNNVKKEIQKNTMEFLNNQLN